MTSILQKVQLKKLFLCEGNSFDSGLSLHRPVLILLVLGARMWMEKLNVFSGTKE